MTAVDKGAATQAPYLEAVMWNNVNPMAVEPRPASLDNDLMRRWVAKDEAAATALLREQWGMARAPETAEEAEPMLSLPDCFDSGLGGHRLTADQLTLETERGTWAVGHCRDCVRALLWWFSHDGEYTTWKFYDQEHSES